MVQIYELCVDLFSRKIAAFAVLLVFIQPEFFLYSATTFKELAIALLTILIWRITIRFVERPQIRFLPGLIFLTYFLYESRWAMAVVLIVCILVVVFIKSPRKRRVMTWVTAALGIVGGFLILISITGGISRQLNELLSPENLYVFRNPELLFERLNIFSPGGVTETSFSRLTSSSSLLGQLAWMPVRFVFTWLYQFPPIPFSSELIAILIALSGLMVQILLPSAAVGIWYLWKRERATIWTIILPFTAMTVMVGSGFAGFHSRYRTAIYPFFMILCAVGIYRTNKNTLRAVYLLYFIAAVIGSIVYVAVKKGYI